MLKQENLAFIKAVTTLQVTPALLRELRTALSARKRRTVVSAEIRGRAHAGGSRSSQRAPSRIAGKHEASVLAFSGEYIEPAIRSPAPEAGSATLHAKSLATGEEAANGSWKIGPQEGGSTYAALLTGFATPNRPSGTINPTAMYSDPSEPAE